MQRIKMMVTAQILVAMVLLGGCVPWKNKYEICNANLESLQAVFDNAQDRLQTCESEKSQLNGQLQAALANLQTAQSQQRKAGGLEGDMGGEYDPVRGTVTVSLASDLFFDAGKVKLKSDPKNKLNRISQIINREHANKEVWVVGHTDKDPIKKSGWKDNWQLSTERALAVTRYLVGQGVSAKQVVAAGCGEFRPISSSKAKNRRVEIVVHTR